MNVALMEAFPTSRPSLQSFKSHPAGPRSPLGLHPDPLNHPRGWSPKQQPCLGHLHYWGHSAFLSVTSGIWGKKRCFVLTLPLSQNFRASWSPQLIDLRVHPKTVNINCISRVTELCSLRPRSGHFHSSPLAVV